MPEIKEKVIDIIVDKTGVDRSKVTPKAKIVDDLRANELELVIIIMAMQEEFGIKIADENAEKLKTVQDFIDFISAGPDTNLKFSATLSAEDQHYLGLEKSGPFTLQDIKAAYVLIEIMRTTCPHCVAQAPALNRLYHLVANSPLKYKVKLIAVGESSYGPALKQFKATHKFLSPWCLIPIGRSARPWISLAPPPPCSWIRAARCCWWKQGPLKTPMKFSRRSKLS